MDYNNNYKNNGLHLANREKKNEFYTMYEDIEKELENYWKYFSGKTILCNCDNPFKSNFFKYFILNFNRFHLKKLIATYKKKKGEKESYKAIIKKVPKDIKEHVFCNINDNNILFSVKENELSVLHGDGDFRSDECLLLLNESDIVVTNPPFSLFREYIQILFENNKKFIIMGNINAVTYKEFFPLIKENKVWIGKSIHSGDRAFYVPDDYPLNAAGCGVDKNGKRFIRVKGVRWYTNLDIDNRHQILNLTKTYVGNEADFQKYDNYDAINVDKVKDIPLDYNGVMGVPITFLDKYNPSQFELISFRKGSDGKDLFYTKDGKKITPYFRILIKKIQK